MKENSSGAGVSPAAIFQRNFIYAIDYLLVDEFPPKA
jgi:hypothetical protein